MAHNDLHINYEGTFDEFLVHTAVATAHAEIAEGEHAHARDIKSKLHSALMHAEEELHEFIGHYGVLINDYPDAREYSETVARVGEKLQHVAQEAHLGTVRLLHDNQREERNGKQKPGYAMHSLIG
ncbi:MAG: hypothetical protein AABW80_02100 [Nanoarchaeota archaeon]